MKNYVQIVDRDKIVEEEVVAVVNNKIVVLFDESPILVDKNNIYEGIIDTFISDDHVKIIKQSGKIKKLERIKNFKYNIYGLVIKPGLIDAGVFIECEDIEEDTYLVDQYISFAIDRLNLWCEKIV